MLVNYSLLKNTPIIRNKTVLLVLICTTPNIGFTESAPLEIRGHRNKIENFLSILNIEELSTELKYKYQLADIQISNPFPPPPS